MDLPSPNNRPIDSSLDDISDTSTQIISPQQMLAYHARRWQKLEEEQRTHYKFTLANGSGVMWPENYIEVAEIKQTGAEIRQAIRERKKLEEKQSGISKEGKSEDKGNKQSQESSSNDSSNLSTKSTPITPTQDDDELRRRQQEARAYAAQAVNERLSSMPQGINGMPIPDMPAGRDKPQSQQTIVLGTNTSTGKDITITDEERLRSISVAGATGTHKSTLLTSMALQAAENGECVIVFAVERDILDNLLVRMPQARMNDVVLLDFSIRDRFIGINHLAEEEDIERYIELFKRLWNIGPETPNLENTLRASLLTLQYNNLTLDRMPDLLRDKVFRASCIASIPTTLSASFVRDFWEKGFYLHNVQEQIHSSDSTLNKVLQFLMDKYIAYIVAQNLTTLNVRKDILDHKKILFIHLSKQDLQPERVRRIGAMLLEELKHALFSRADLPIHKRHIVNLICDEWQLYVTPDFFEDVLSQGRRYGISTVLATQTLENFDNKLQAILDQVGTHITFAVGVKDAVKLAYHYARDAQPYMREQEKKTPIPKPIDWLLSGYRGAHTNPVIYDFVKQWLLEETKRNTRDEREQEITTFHASSASVTSRGRGRLTHSEREGTIWITHSGQVYRALLEQLNDFLYHVMRGDGNTGNPYQVFPLGLFLWQAINRQAGFLDTELLPAVSFEKRQQLSLDALQDGSKFSYMFTVEEPDFIKVPYYLNKYRYPDIARMAMKENLDPPPPRKVPPQDFIGCLLDGSEKRRQAYICYSDLWRAKDEETLQQAFLAYEQVVRAYLKNQMEKELAWFIHHIQSMAKRKGSFEHEKLDLFSAYYYHPRLEIDTSMFELEAFFKGRLALLLGLTLDTVLELPVHVRYTDNWEETHKLPDSFSLADRVRNSNYVERSGFEQVLIMASGKEPEPEWLDPNIWSLAKQFCPDALHCHAYWFEIDSEDLQKIARATLLFMQHNLPRILHECMIPHWKEIIANIPSFITYCHRMEQLRLWRDRTWEKWRKKTEYYTGWVENMPKEPEEFSVILYNDVQQQPVLAQRIVGNWLRGTPPDRSWSEEIAYAIQRATTEIERFEGYLAHPYQCVEEAYNKVQEIIQELSKPLSSPVRHPPGTLETQLGQYITRHGQSYVQENKVEVTTSSALLSLEKELNNIWHHLFVHGVSNVMESYLKGEFSQEVYNKYTGRYSDDYHELRKAFFQPRIYCHAQYDIGNTVLCDTDLRTAFALPPRNRQVYPPVVTITQEWIDQAKERIQEKIDLIITEQKPYFEAYVREIQDFLEAIADVPMRAGSGIYEMVEVGRRSNADMREDKVKELLGLPDGIAYVAMRMRGDRFKPRMKTKELPFVKPAVAAQLLKEHKEHALKNAEAYTTKAKEIDQEFWQRRQRLGIAPSPVVQPPQEEKENDAPVPLHVAKRRVYNPSGDGYLPPLTFGDGLSPTYQYLLPLYHVHYLTLKQFCKLLGKTNETHVREDLNELIGKVVGKGLITKEQITGNLNVKAGRVPLVYSLTNTGMEKLKDELELSSGTRKGTFSEHTLLVNDALISLMLASKLEPSIRLVGLRHERTFSQQKIPVGDGFLQPDGFLHFQLSPPFGVEHESVGVCLEIDRGSESKLQWQEKVQKYIDFAGGVYQKQFGLESLTIAVCRPGGNVRELVRWTKEAVKDKKEYAPLIIFTNSNPVDCDPVEWVTAPVWTNIENTPYALIEKLQLQQQVPDVPQPQEYQPYQQGYQGQRPDTEYTGVQQIQYAQESQEQQMTLLQKPKRASKESEPFQPVQPAQPTLTSGEQFAQQRASLTYERYKAERKAGSIDPSLKYEQWYVREVKKLLKQKDG